MKRKLLLTILTLTLALCSLFGLTACASHTHNFATLKYDSENHWFECECKEKTNIVAHNIKNGECICGYIVPHSHEYNTLKYDAENHWYECECKEKTNIVAHNIKNGECICGYVVPHSHEYNILKYDAENHWYECSCGAYETKENHKGGTATETSKAVCSECNQSYGTIIGHTHNYQATKTPPKCGEKGYTTYSCECGDSYISALIILCI